MESPYFFTEFSFSLLKSITDPGLVNSEALPRTVGT